VIDAKDYNYWEITEACKKYQDKNKKEFFKFYTLESKG